MNQKFKSSMHRKDTTASTWTQAIKIYMSNTVTSKTNSIIFIFSTMTFYMFISVKITF